MKKWGIVIAVLAAIVAVVALVFAVFPSAAPVPGEFTPRSYSAQVYMEPGGAKQVVATGGAIELQAGGDLVATPGATIVVDDVTLGDVSADSVTSAGAVSITAGGLTVTAGGVTISDGDAVVADDLRIVAQTAITVTNGAAFTATGTYQPIQAAGEVTPTITAGTAGQLLCLVNVSAETINLADLGDGNGQDLTAAIALEQNEAILLLSDGTDWLEISRAEN